MRKDGDSGDKRSDYHRSYSEYITGIDYWSQEKNTLDIMRTIEEVQP